MKRFSAVIFVCLSLSSPALLYAQEILLKKGSPIRMEDVLSKDQFGVMVSVRTDPATGEKLRRFIPFAEMNPNSLQYFPFCDMKAAERIDNAVRDRIELLAKKFKEERKGFKGIRDFTKKLSIHTGVSSYRVWFEAVESTPCGLIGWLYSDSPESSFYGMVHLYGLLGKPGTVWIGTIYPAEKTFQNGALLYPEFTVIEPPKKMEVILPGKLPAGAELNTAAPAQRNTEKTGKGAGNALPDPGR